MLLRIRLSCLVAFFVTSLMTALCTLAEPSLAHAEEQLMSPELFLEQAFGGHAPESKLLMLPADLKAQAQQLLGHPYSGMRVRYWWHEGTSAWILDEIGKEKPITLGVVIKDQKIQSVQLLVYREERGGEIRLVSFRDQFRGAVLKGDQQLDRPIDGITGATLSVNATRNVARMALLFHRYVAAKHS